MNNKNNQNLPFIPYKRLTVCTLILLGLGTVGMTEAIAGSITLKLRSLVCEGDIVGIAQQECPTGAGTCTVQCELINAQVDYLCQNNGGGTGGEGNPFHGTISLGSELTAFTDTPVEGSGKEFVSMHITDSQIITTLNPLCAQQNQNWSIATEAGACANDDPYSGYLRPVALVTSTLMRVTATDTQGDVTVYNSNCTLNPFYNDINLAPLCPADVINSGIEAYTCTNNKSLNLR